MEPETSSTPRRAGRADVSGADGAADLPAESYRWLPDGYPAKVAEAFARFGDRYDDICAELFDDDPVLGMNPPFLQGAAGDSAAASVNVIDVDEVEWVDRAPPGFDPAIREAWAAFAVEYPAIAAELFDHDPELTAVDTTALDASQGPDGP
ncbi:hypothetical protein [Candidatus Poriferisodalis sp.]|uniref:hypothetical protein n=1 Tax=Candidatus Poriferisodalis sp. TaxID=3101277 RepID=UPI003B016A7E